MKPSSKSSRPLFRNRQTIAANLAQYENQQGSKSQRQLAASMGIPRETLNYWRKRKLSIPLDPEIVSFFESQVGNKFLHRLITGLQFVMTGIGGCGIRFVQEVLELTQLHYFVSSSVGTLCERAKQMEAHIIQFGEEERKRLSADMTKKKISLVEDETFHPAPCLVAIEPVSNFIMVEIYSEKRDAPSWNQFVDQGLSGLDVEVIQVTSDEAKGIVNHVTTHFGSHHSPDIFHVQYDITKASSAALSAKVRRGEAALESAEEAIVQRKAFDAAPPRKGRGRPPNVASQSLDELMEKQQIAKTQLEKAIAQRDQVKAAKKSIGATYHPYDLTTGKAIDVEQLESTLKEQFNIIETTCRQAELKDTSMKKIEKAKRMISKLGKTLQFFWSMLNNTIDALNLSDTLASLMKAFVIPYHYLMSASKKSPTSDKRQAITQVANDMSARLNLIVDWQLLSERERARLEDIAKACANYFQRSSSCVEGRNGYLSLRHHGLHHLSKRKLKTLTTIHNYYIQRQDNTTAAERFFESPTRNLFDYLLEKMPSPGRCRKINKLLKMAT